MPPDPDGFLANLIAALTGRNRPGGSPETSVGLAPVQAATPVETGFTQDLGNVRFADFLAQTLEGPFVQDTLTRAFGGLPTFGVATQPPAEARAFTAFVDPAIRERVQFTPIGLRTQRTPMNLGRTLTHETTHAQIGALAQTDEQAAQFLQDMQAIQREVLPEAMNERASPSIPLLESTRSEAEHLGYAMENAMAILRTSRELDEDQLKETLDLAEAELPGTTRAFRFLQERLEPQD